MTRRKLNKRHRLLLRWSIATTLGVAALGAALLIGAVRSDPAALEEDGSVAGLTSVLSRTVTAEHATFTFNDVTADAGIAIRHLPGGRQSLLPEDMGPGVAWGDYDDDGDPDLFFVNYTTSDDPEGACALFRNDGDGVFTDVSRQSGLDLRIGGQAAAWGDYDNDDDLDLYVTAFGPNVLMRNNGDGAFTDVSESAGVADPAFGAGCAWGDFDRDGHIDLYVCNYVDFAVSDKDRTRTAGQYGLEIPYTINPSAFSPASNRLYRNNGAGGFTDVATAAGVANPEGRSLGAVWFDFNLDGLVDLYVANDVSSNGVYLNNGDGSFTDIGAASLAADYRGAMGMALGDVDADGDQDLFVTHWVAQENAFFDNMSLERWPGADGQPRIFFMDSADVMGLGQISLKTVGWSTGFTDFDNDAWLDLWVVNGHTMQDRQDPSRLLPQPVHLFRQAPEEGFFEIAALACPVLHEIVGRGGAHADFDGDGKMDLVVTTNAGAPILLQNTSPSPGHWLKIRLRQAGRNTRALGASVTVTAGGRTQTKQVGADGSYFSQHEIDLHFGLGDSDDVEEIEIQWPDGCVEGRLSIGADQTLAIAHPSHD